MEDIFGEAPAPMPAREDFKYHTLTIVLLAGQGEFPEGKVKCDGANKKDCICTDAHCQLKELIDSVGLWDVIRSEEDIELVELSARIDWSDYEEPWVDVVEAP